MTIQYNICVTLLAAYAMCSNTKHFEHESAWGWKTLRTRYQHPFNSFPELFTYQNSQIYHHLCLVKRSFEWNSSN